MSGCKPDLRLFYACSAPFSRLGEMNKLLQRSFYERDTVTVARELLGQRLVRVLEDGRRLAGLVVEAEAYVGEADRACHAACGRTPRNAIMYGPAGYAYVYLIYGMYHCLNVVTEREGFPAAVLIRALEPTEGIETMRDQRAGKALAELTSGPGRLCRALAIDRRLNGRDLCAEGSLFIEEGHAPAEVLAGPRIGIVQDEAARQRPWRFVVAGNPFVSHRKP